jgi:hypothetical protein
MFYCGKNGAVEARMGPMRSLALILGLLAAVAAAEEATPFRRFADASSDLTKRAAASGGVAKSGVLGKSSGGREILLLTIGTGERVDTRPALLVVAGIEGDGIGGSEIAAAFAAELMAAQDERTRKLLSERTVYVIARLNPDGIERFFDALKRQDSGASAKWDEDKDGSDDEDGPDDLDGDGMILVMRVEDAAGEWVADEKDAGFMRKPDAVRGEHGAWRLLPEGRDDDGDGAWNEDGAGGVDLNSNFPWNYRFHAPRVGPYPLSEPESRALAEFVAAHPNIEAAFTFASNDNLIRQVGPSPPPNPLPDPGSPVMGLDAGDVLPLAGFAENYRTKLGRERRDPAGHREGGLAEWMYFHWGILSLDSPGWSVPWKGADAKGLATEDGPGREARWAFRWMRENRATEWVEWHAFAHPDFPGKKVEIGGWKPYSTVLPPTAEMEALTTKHGAFLRDVLGAFPKIAVKSLAAKKLDASLWEITATISNEGALPTALRQGTRTQRARAIRVDFISATGSLTAGDKVVLVPVLAAGGVKELKWVLHANEGTEVEIKAETDRAGRSSAKFSLK